VYHTPIDKCVYYARGDHGVLPDSAPFYMHSQVVMHYLDGAVFPRGGSTKIAEGLCKTIESSGGRVLVRAPVTSILTTDDNTRATGVRLANGDEFFAKTIVSNCGFLNTRDKILDDSARAQLPPSWLNFEVRHL